MFLRRQVANQPSRISNVILCTSFFLTLNVSMAMSLHAADGIATVQENGRTVYINAVSPEEKAVVRAAIKQRSTRLIYWSNAEHCWKPVPTPPASVMYAARNAAAEVASYVNAQPRTNKPASVNPNYRQLASG